MCCSFMFFYTEWVSLAFSLVWWSVLNLHTGYSADYFTPEIFTPPKYSISDISVMNVLLSMNKKDKLFVWLWSKVKYVWLGGGYQIEKSWSVSSQRKCRLTRDFSCFVCTHSSKWTFHLQSRSCDVTQGHNLVTQWINGWHQNGH